MLYFIFIELKVGRRPNAPNRIRTLSLTLTPNLSNGIRTRLRRAFCRRPEQKNTSATKKKASLYFTVLESDMLGVSSEGQGYCSRPSGMSKVWGCAVSSAKRQTFLSYPPTQITRALHVPVTFASIRPLLLSTTSPGWL